MGHREYGRSDPRFWGKYLCYSIVRNTHFRTDWTIRELAMYDLPALVAHVCSVTGYSKVCQSTTRSFYRL